MNRQTEGQRTFVVGVGMTRFERPGRREWDYPDMVNEAATAALADAGIEYSEVEQALAGYVYGDTTAGQRALYTLGLTGIPIYNVNNACATGSTALRLARQLVAGGAADCILAVGFEKMGPGAIRSPLYTDRADPHARHREILTEVAGSGDSPVALRFYSAAGLEHQRRYGTTDEQFAAVAVKNHRHSTGNPNAQFQSEFTLEEVLASTPYGRPLTKLQCSPTSEGAAAAVVMSEDAVSRHGLEKQAVEMVGQAMTSDQPVTFEGASCISLVGFEMTQKAARAAYDEAGIGPEDVQVIELHDCFSVNELLTYEAIGLCAPGDSGPLVESGQTTHGGRWVVNPSGGLISKGHPLGATGLAQCAELCWQLRGLAGARQVSGARRALQHNMGLGGATVVTIFEAPPLTR